MHEREGPALLHRDRHPVRPGADDLGVPDRGQGLDPALDLVGAQPEEVGAGRDGRGVGDRPGRHPARPPHLHGGHGEAGGGEDEVGGERAGRQRARGGESRERRHDPTAGAARGGPADALRPDQRRPGADVFVGPVHRAR